MTAITRPVHRPGRPLPSRRPATSAVTAVVVLAAALAACRADEAPDPGAVTIMTFNVENLFDTRDDPGKDDRTFLPLAAKQTEAHRAACARIDVDRWRTQCLDWDWNEDVLARKLGAVADAILQVNGGRGPDIVALQEIENLAVLERLRREKLAAAGYRPAVLIEGQDARGIDVAFLTRLPLAVEPRLHRIDFPGAPAARVADTRGILEAVFELPDGSLLTGYAVHFPAPFHPGTMRETAYRKLNELAGSLPPDRPAFAAGDFNTTSAEDRREALLERFVRPHWTVAHEVGCDGCPGTQYYAPTGAWSFLDMLLWAPAERGSETTWRLRPDSVRLANTTPAQRRADGTPARFTLPEGRGVADHWPLVVTIELQIKQ